MSTDPTTPTVDETPEEYEAFMAAVRAYREEIDRATGSGRYAPDAKDRPEEPTMTGIEVEVEVPESRQVTITLAPDVPVGRRVRLAVAVYEPGPPRRFVARYDPNQTVCYSGQVVILPDEEPG